MTTTPDRPDDAALERTLRVSRHLEDAPEPVIQRAIAAWRSRSDATPKSLLQQVLAALTFDSGTATPLAFGMRSAGSSQRQLLFNAEGRDIDLRIAAVDPAAIDPARALWQLSGQVLGPDAAGTVHLGDTSGSLIAEAALNELGEFRLTAVPAGTFVVTLRFLDAEVVLPPLQVPQGR